LGPKFKRSRRLIEIDITYLCNLQCPNCNRSLGEGQLPGQERMTLSQIDDFIADSTKRGIRWERIRLLGGEPTLHPELSGILKKLIKYKEEVSPHTRIEVKSNGYGKKVQQVLHEARKLGVVAIDSGKTPEGNPRFHHYNIAPVDLQKYQDADFSNGCHITEVCGIGLSLNGYYPCAVAAGIDRVFELNLGQSKLPGDEDDMTEMLERFCRLCGHFRHSQGEPEFPEGISPSWSDAYLRASAQRSPSPSGDGDLVQLETSGRPKK
jgi:hypothetical protein